MMCPEVATLLVGACHTHAYGEVQGFVRLSFVVVRNVRNGEETIAAMLQFHPISPRHVTLIETNLS